MDFGKGKLVTVVEAASKAKAAFGKTWAVDARLADAKIFVRGAWDEPSFSAAFRLVTAVPPAETLPLDSLLAALPNGPLADFRTGSYSREAIEAMAPDARAWFEKQGVSVGTRLDCLPGLWIHLYGLPRPDPGGNFAQQANAFLLR